MGVVEIIADDLMAALTPEEVSEAFGVTPSPDIRERLVDWLLSENNRRPARIASQLGQPLVRKILRKLGIDFELRATPEALVAQWLQDREMETLIPSARPQELADTLADLASQIRISPEKFAVVDLLVSRCTLLLRYVALYYARDLGLADSVEIANWIADRSFEQLCQLLGTNARVAREPYKAFSERGVTITNDRAQEILFHFPLHTHDVPEIERANHAKIVCDHVLGLLEQWRPRSMESLIPKGAVVDEFILSGRGHRGTFYDENSRRITISAIAAAMDSGDNVLLAVTDEDSFSAQRLKPLPRADAWITPKETHGRRTVKSNPMRRISRRVFMSYSHEDQEWAERVRLHLKPLVKQNIIDLWDDQLIRASELWEEKIEAALETSSIAILVISPDFLASDYIQDKELPRLLSAARDEDAKILTLFVRPTFCDLHAELMARQGVNHPETPLQNLPQHEQDRILAKLAGEIATLCKTRR